ncbi:hypothetical protein [uncultured Agrobacterium sp.]|uniref:hypothetical protein n=1 Tax=uncultured Agrobacterium sp. TaxID=157277 RepID=UPI0025CFEF48|nr:hypothetical protein [uncultured Agrobacterium sp.]
MIWPCKEYGELDAQREEASAKKRVQKGNGFIGTRGYPPRSYRRFLARFEKQFWSGSNASSVGYAAGDKTILVLVIAAGRRIKVWLEPCRQEVVS